MWLRDLRLSNVKCFDTLHLSFEASGRANHPRRWTVIVGENGRGKSTLIRAIALAYVTRLAPGYFERAHAALLRAGQAEGLVTACFETREGEEKSDSAQSLQARIDLHRMGDAVHWTVPRASETGADRSEELDDPSSFFLCAYSPSRTVPSTTSARIRFTLPNLCARRVLSLFEESADLVLPEECLAKLAHARGQRKRHELATILKLTRIDLASRSGSALIRQGDAQFPIGELSDGYRGFLTWVCDLTCHLFDAYKDSPDPTQEPGVVLVDEIDLHLHPEWQIRVVADLKRTFPRLQFVATTHNPLLLRGLEPDEVKVLRCSEEGGTIEIVDGAELADVTHLRSDQILRSPLFGLRTDRDPKLNALLEEYYGLLARRDRSPRQETRLQKLRKEVRSCRRRGSSLEEEIFFSAIDRHMDGLEEAAAEQVQVSRAPVRDDSKLEGVIERIRKTWRPPNEGVEKSSRRRSHR